MRIAGYLLILLSIAPLGFGGWTEFVYLSDVSSRYEKQMEETDKRYQKQIETYKKNLDNQVKLYQNNAALPQSTKDQMITALRDQNEKILAAAETQFDSSRKTADDMMSKAIDQVRSTYYTFPTIAVGVLLLVGGLFLAFRKKAVTSD